MEYMESKMQEIYNATPEDERDDFVSKLIDQLDLNRDEFLRIATICSALIHGDFENVALALEYTKAIQGMCERSQQVIAQTVPVIVQRDKYQRDVQRIEAMELEAKDSPSGISFDYCRHVEDGHAVEKGFRFMRKHHLGPRCATLREAFDKRAQEG